MTPRDEIRIEEERKEDSQLDGTVDTSTTDCTQIFVIMDEDLPILLVGNKFSFWDEGQQQGIVVQLRAENGRWGGARRWGGEKLTRTSRNQ